MFVLHSLGHESHLQGLDILKEPFPRRRTLTTIGNFVCPPFRPKPSFDLSCLPLPCVASDLKGGHSPPSANPTGPLPSPPRIRVSSNMAPRRGMGCERSRDAPRAATFAFARSSRSTALLGDGAWERLSNAIHGPVDVDSYVAGPAEDHLR